MGVIGVPGGETSLMQCLPSSRGFAAFTFPHLPEFSWLHLLLAFCFLLGYTFAFFSPPATSFLILHSVGADTVLIRHVGGTHSGLWGLMDLFCTWLLHFYPH